MESDLNLSGKEEENIDNGKNKAPTPEAFLASPYIQTITALYKRPATLLNPQTSIEALSPDVSKFGGLPNTNGFKEYPCCDVCATPLNFVLQLFKDDFPELYFPEGKSLFQLFRCPNHECADAFSDTYQSDLKMFVFYFQESIGDINGIAVPEPDLEMEPKVPDCYLKPTKIEDYPCSEDFEDVGSEIEETFGEEYYEYFSDAFYATQRTKIGGYPSFTQSAHYPTCSCGKAKEFFFQLSSEDTEEGVENPVPDNWAPHHIMIGDLGNIYFYVCKDCGEKSIESYWDCY